jgi:asparagine synthase (glutamine-hydrolysing)
MAHSVEIRVPFVDVEFLKQISPELSYTNAPPKRDVAAVASKLMTPEILDRRKTGFQIPVRDWLVGQSRKAKAGGRPSERGLRGWAKHIHARFIDAERSPRQIAPA